MPLNTMPVMKSMEAVVLEICLYDLLRLADLQETLSKAMASKPANESMLKRMRYSAMMTATMGAAQLLAMPTSRPSVCKEFCKTLTGSFFYADKLYPTMELEVFNQFIIDLTEKMVMSYATNETFVIQPEERQCLMDYCRAMTLVVEL